MNLKGFLLLDLKEKNLHTQKKNQFIATLHIHAKKSQTNEMNKN